MISAPRIVVASVIFFPMGLFYYSSDNAADYTINARNPPAASAMLGSGARGPTPLAGTESYPLEWTSKGPESNLEGGATRGGRSRQERSEA